MYQALLSRIAGELTRSHIPYTIIGGQAALLYGEPRLTKAIDISLGVGVDELEKVKRVASGLRLKPLVDSVEGFVKKTMVLPVQDPASGIRVDFMLSFSPYEQEAIERAKPIAFGDTVVRFAALEDVVIQKVIGGRPRDLEDVHGILLKNPEYDGAYITKWLRKFDTAMDETFSDTFHALLDDLQ